MGLFYVNCDEASHICNRSQYNEASFSEIIKLKIHHLFCKVCRYHSKKNCGLTNLLKKSDIHALDSDFKTEMRKQIQKELSDKQK